MQQSTGVMLLIFLLAGCGGTSSPGESSTEGGSGSSPPNVSDPNEPPAQGAVLFQVRPASPQPTGLSCPTSSFTAGIPDTSLMPTDTLSDTSYTQKVVDGEGGVAFSCRVASENGWEFAGEIVLGGRSFRISEGQLPAQGDGSASIRITDALRLEGSMASSEPCVVQAMSTSGTGNLQIKAGSMWASFDCAAVEAPPTSSCAAAGYFVLENCAQQ